MPIFDYEASAELFAARGHPGFRYQRITQVAEAIRYAIEKLPPKVLAGSSLEVQIRALYVSQLYPLSRNKRAY